MKILKNPIFIFILGIVIATCLGVYAGTKISASNITYIDQNNNEKTVDVVLNELYSLANVPFSYTAISPNSSQGARIASRSTSVTLNKGKYILATFGSLNTFNTSEINTTSASYNALISCSNCTHNLISSRQIQSSASKARNSSYETINNSVNLFYVDIEQDNTVVTASENSTDNDTATSQITILGFKVN